MQVIVNIDVDDLDKAIQCYTTALDLRLNRRLFDSSVAEMVGPTATIHLLLKPTGTAPFDSSVVTRHYQRHWTPRHLDFAVEDIFASGDRATARLRWRGNRPEGEVVERETIEIVRVENGKAVEHWGGRTTS